MDARNYNSVWINGTHTFSYETLAVGTYRFVIEDRQDDGICCGYGEGSVEIWNEGVRVCYSDGKFGSSFQCPDFALNTRHPSSSPSASPSDTPSTSPSKYPSSQPSAYPSAEPSAAPTGTISPSVQPSSAPSFSPSSVPSVTPTSPPSANPSSIPSEVPSFSQAPSYSPSTVPSIEPSEKPSAIPSNNPRGPPSTNPSFVPSSFPSYQPSIMPSDMPSESPYPSGMPSPSPSGGPSVSPSLQPSGGPSGGPSLEPSERPSNSQTPSGKPSVQPSFSPTLSQAPSATADCPYSFDSFWTSEAALTCTCQQEQITSGSVWGSDIYTSDSSICRAARHAGVVGDIGGLINVHAAPGQVLYQSTLRNGITSSSRGSYPSSFTVAGPPSDAPSLVPSSSQSPSANPSVSPSAIPTTLPSSEPSVSQNPSSRPSDLPSTSPSLTPSSAPSREPSVEPSSYPTTSPCSNDTDCDDGSHCTTNTCVNGLCFYTDIPLFQNKIFVAVDGDDANSGLCGFPVQTIAKGLELSNFGQDVWVGAGTHNITVSINLISGVNLRGGYDPATWIRDITAFKTIINGGFLNNRPVSVYGWNIYMTTYFEGFTVQAADAVESTSPYDLSSYGLYCGFCRGLVIQNNTIVAGNGAKNLNAPSDGWTGSDGYPGNHGQCSTWYVCWLIYFGLMCSQITF